MHKACFTDFRAAFTPEVLGTVINQLVDTVPIPTLFMRTVCVFVCVCLRIPLSVVTLESMEVISPDLLQTKHPSLCACVCVRVCAAFTPEVLGTVINQLVDTVPIPTLFMRTVCVSVSVSVSGCGCGCVSVSVCVCVCVCACVWVDGWEGVLVSVCVRVHAPICVLFFLVLRTALPLSSCLAVALRNYPPRFGWV